MDRRVNTALLACLAAAVPSFVGAQADPTLTQAYISLQNQDFQSAATLSNQYLQTHEPVFEAAYIHAVALCELGPRPSSQAVAELQWLNANYVLNANELNAIGLWVSWCSPPPPSPPPTPGVSVSGGLMQMPSLSWVPAPGGPNHQVRDTSYSGGDYKSEPAANSNVCVEECQAETQCRAETYIISTNTCWLKTSVPPAQHAPDFISWVKGAGP